MALQPNPQRGTERRGTGVRPAPAPAAAPAAQGGANRPTGRRPGAPAPGGAARPPVRSAPPQQGSGKVGKYLLLTIIVLLLGMVGYGFVPRKAADGTSKPGLFMALIKKYLPTAKTEGAEELPDLDRRYARAIEWRDKAKAYIDEQTAKFKEKPEALTEVERGRVADEIEKHRGLVETGTDDLARVAAANGQGTKIGADAAKEEQKKQKAYAMELGRTLVKWRGSLDRIFAKSDEPEFVANKFTAKKPEEPKEEKKEPRRGAGESAVAPLDPKDAPKLPPPPAEPEKPKEEPKPAEPKPEPEKPKPAEPKPEPKPEPEKPKPEPEKPKPVEPKPEPEKPKPAEPKPEPEKPKEEPKPEPKPEKKLDVILAEADKLILDGTPMVKEVITASRNLPDDQEKLKTLLMKGETAQAFFVKAREAYTGVKDAAPESANVPKTLEKIEKILDLLQKTTDGIKSKMK